MIEENVVSAAGAPYRFTANSIQEAICTSGFLNRSFATTNVAGEKCLKHQVIDY